MTAGGQRGEGEIHGRGTGHKEEGGREVVGGGDELVASVGERRRGESPAAG